MKAAFAFIALIPALAWGQTIQKPKVYIDPSNAFANSFSAGVEKKQVPVTLSTDPIQSGYAVNLTAGD